MMGGVETPSLFERVAYRSLGVRLDDRWRSWVQQDLADPRWIRRHRLSQIATFAVVGVITFSATAVVLGEVPWAGAGGFLGALLGQLLFGELKHRQAEKSHLSPNGPWISGPLPFPHRVVLAGATLVLILALLVAGAFAIRVDEDCRPASAFATAQLARSVDPTTSLLGGVGYPIEQDFVEVVAVGMQDPGRGRQVGVWAVRADGNVFPLNDAASRVTTLVATSVSFTEVDVAKISAQLQSCV